MFKTFHLMIAQKKCNDIVDNIEEFGVGALNIGGSLIYSTEYQDGRKPSNVILVEGQKSDIIKELNSDKDPHDFYKVLGDE